jgi:hypothetical protein
MSNIWGHTNFTGFVCEYIYALKEEEEYMYTFMRTIYFFITDANFPEMVLKEPFKKDVIRQSSFKAGRVAAWVLDTAGFEQCNKSQLHIFSFCSKY